MGMGWQEENKIMALDFEWGKSLELAEMMRHWSLNIVAKRFRQVQDDAFHTAHA
jgi:hypothetical protein